MPQPAARATSPSAHSVHHRLPVFGPPVAPTAFPAFPELHPLLQDVCQFFSQQQWIPAHVEIPPLQLSPVVHGHHPALGYIMLRFGLVVLEPLDLQDQAGPGRLEIHLGRCTEYGTFMLRNALAVAIILDKEDGDLGF